MSHRCECGSRTFFSKPISVICQSGVVLDARDFKYLSCVSCSRSYVCSMDPGKKSLVAAPSGRELERTLFGLTVEYGTFGGKDGPVNFILQDEDDRKDLKRLGIEMREPQKA